MYKRCVCGKFFNALTKKQKYCSDKCRPKKKYYKANLILLKICDQCGKSFTTGRNTQRFCTDKCRLKYHSTGKKYEKICRNCGFSFITGKSYQYYCTEYCYHSAKRERDLKNIHKIREKK